MMLALGAKEVGSNPTDPSDGAITLPTFRSLVLPQCVGNDEMMI